MAGLYPLTSPPPQPNATPDVSDKKSGLYPLDTGPQNTPPQGGRYNFDSLKSLLRSADGSLQDDDYNKLAHVAMAESTGDPNQVSPHGAEGLWQILPSVHGKGNWKDPVTAAKYAIQLYKQNGLKDWEESRLKGAGGGWGQYVDGTNTGGGNLYPLTDATPAPNQKLPPGGMAALLGKKGTTQEAGLDPTPVLAPITEAYTKGEQHVEKVAHHWTDPARNFMSEQWERMIGPEGYVSRPTEGLLNVISTPQRMVDAAIQTADRVASDPKEKGNPWIGAVEPIEVTKAALGAAFHPEDNDKIVTDLERQFGAHFGFDVDGLQHSAWGKFAKVALDIIVETGTDPLTYVPIADALTVPGRIARIAATNHVSMAAATHVLDLLNHYPATAQLTKALYNAYTSARTGTAMTAKAVSQIFNTVFKNKRDELNQFFNPAGKNIYMATESAVDHGKSQLAKEHAGIVDQDYKTIKGLGLSPRQQQADLGMQYRYGGQAGRQDALKSGYVPNDLDRKSFRKPFDYIQYDAKGKPLYDLPPGLSTKEAQSYRKEPDAFKTFLTPLEAKTFAQRLGISTTQLAKQRFDLAREALGRKQVAFKMADMVRSNPSLIKGIPATASSFEEFFHNTVANAPNMVEGAGRATAQFLSKTPEGKEFVDATKWVGGKYAGAMKQVQRVYSSGIKLNFAPHAIFNVGTITAARGGLPVAAKGLAYGMDLFAIKPLTDLAQQAHVARIQSLLDRLHANGGIGSSFSGDLMMHLPEAIRNVPMLGDALRLAAKGPKTYLSAMQHGLESFEAGYRAAYLEHLDSVMGPSKTAEDEMLKGAKVLNDIGDYKNRTYAVKFLNALGGVFTNFRASIAPATIANAIKHQGVLSTTKGMQTLPVVPLILRIEHELNENNIAGRGWDETWGGPIGDAAASITPQYQLSSGTIGPVASGAAHRYVEGVEKDPSPWSIIQPIKDSLDATGVPGMSTFDAPPKVAPWLSTSHWVAGSYEQARPGRAAFRREKSYIRRTDEE